MGCDILTASFERQIKKNWLLHRQRTFFATSSAVMLFTPGSLLSSLPRIALPFVSSPEYSSSDHVTERCRHISLSIVPNAPRAASSSSAVCGVLNAPAFSPRLCLKRGKKLVSSERNRGNLHFPILGLLGVNEDLCCGFTHVCDESTEEWPVSRVDDCDALCWEVQADLAPCSDGPINECTTYRRCVRKTPAPAQSSPSTSRRPQSPRRQKV